MAGFGSSIKLEGESEYRRALQQINQSLREVGSEMKVVSSSFDKNDKSAQAMAQRSDVLNKKLEEQKNKLGILTQKYNEMNATYGKNSTAQKQLTDELTKERAKLDEIGSTLGKTSKEYQEQQKVVNDLENKQMQYNNAVSKAKTEMNQAQAEVNKTTRELDDLSKEEEDVTKKTKEVGDGFTVFKGILANLGTQAINGAINGLKSMGSALLNVGKQAIESYAEYEQLAGGVETLFKDSAPIVQKYANEAYKTAGLSANQYMETVTGFSASLLQSLDGDTQKTAEYSNRAIIDMSDNANKMGTSMEMIQNAYQGFAKQNYTMLDNLKLGYGGTKEEMKRLISDSSKLTDVQKKLGITVDANDMSFGNIVNAISVMQTSMDISGYSTDQLKEKLKDMSLTEEEVTKVANDMGVSYEEASKRMKDGTLTVKDASILLGTTARESATTIQGSVNSMKGAWSNLLTGMADDNADFEKLINNFVESVLTVGDNILPRIKTVITGIGKMVSGLLKELVPQLVKEIPPLLQEMLPVLVDAVKVSLDAIIEVLPMIIDAISELIPQIIQALLEMLPQIIDVGIKGILSLIQGLTDALPTLIAMLPDIIMQIVNTLVDNLPQLIDTGIEMLNALVDGLIEALPTLIDYLPEIIDKVVMTLSDNMPKLVEAGITLTVKLAEGLIKALPQLISKIPQIMGSLMNGIINYYGKLLEIGKNLLSKLISGIGSMLGSLGAKAGEIGTTIINKIKNIPSQMLNWGKDMIQGLINGITGMIGNVGKAVGKVADKIKNFLHFSRPDEGPLREYEQWMPDFIQGLSNSLDKASPELINQVKNLSNEMSQAMQPNMTINGSNFGETTSSNINTLANYNSLIEAFTEALEDMKIELDGEEVGSFVKKTVENAIYT